MRVFVTGATGFIGSAIVLDLLQAGHRVVGLARSAEGERKLAALGAEARRGSLQDPDNLRRGAADADGAIHTAFFHALSHMSLSTRLTVLLGGLPGGIVSRFVDAAVAADRQAIETLASALKGRGGALVAAFPTMSLTPGRVAVETDAVDPGAPGGPRGRTEDTMRALAGSGARPAIVRLPPIVHGDGDRTGLLPRLFENARKKGVSAYVDGGANRWPTVHVRDAARLFRLALEQGVAGVAYHAVAEEGIPFHQIARLIGEHAGVPVADRPGAEASKMFGFLAPFVATDNPVSSGLTRERLGWAPSGPDLMTDIRDKKYFVA